MEILSRLVSYVFPRSARGTKGEGKKEKARLKKDFEGKQKKLDQMQEELKKVNKEEIAREMEAAKKEMEKVFMDNAVEQDQ